MSFATPTTSQRIAQLEAQLAALEADRQALLANPLHDGNEANREACELETIREIRAVTAELANSRILLTELN